MFTIGSVFEFSFVFSFYTVIVCFKFTFNKKTMFKLNKLKLSKIVYTFYLKS